MVYVKGEIEGHYHWSGNGQFRTMRGKGVFYRVHWVIKYDKWCPPELCIILFEVKTMVVGKTSDSTGTVMIQENIPMPTLLLL